MSSAAAKRKPLICLEMRGLQFENLNISQKLDLNYWDSKLVILDYIVTLNQVKEPEWMLTVYIGLGKDRFKLTSKCRKEAD